MGILIFGKWLVGFTNNKLPPYNRHKTKGTACMVSFLPYT